VMDGTVRSDLHGRGSVCLLRPVSGIFEIGKDLHGEDGEDGEFKYKSLREMCRLITVHGNKGGSIEE
jgi:hypothetical protein